jgi:hypothetical protein
LETKEKKETAKPLHTFTSLHGRQRIRFAFSSAKNKNNKNNNRNKQEETKKKVQFPATRLDLFKQDRKNMRANLYVVPDIFFDQEGYFGKWKSGDSQESEAWIAGLVDSRGGGGGGVILSVVGAIDKRNRGKIALRSSCLLAMVRRKRRVLSYRLSGETPAGAYKTRLG